MERDENGVMRWVYTKHLYRDWGSLKACLIAFSLAPAILFVFFMVVLGFAEGFSLSSLVTQCKICGLVLAIFWGLLLPSYYLMAWAKGGVDEWEYEMDSRTIKGRKIAHNQGRLKFLRAIAWITAFFPMKPGQRVAMNNFLHGKEKKTKDIDLVMLTAVECDEKKDMINITTLYSSEEIHVPREDYAEVRAFIEQLLPRKKPTRRKKKTANTSGKND